MENHPLWAEFAREYPFTAHQVQTCVGFLREHAQLLFTLWTRTHGLNERLIVLENHERLVAPNLEESEE